MAVRLSHETKCPWEFFRGMFFNFSAALQLLPWNQQGAFMDLAKLGKSIATARFEITLEDTAQLWGVRLDRSVYLRYVECDSMERFL